MLQSTTKYLEGIGCGCDKQAQQVGFSNDYDVMWERFYLMIVIIYYHWPTAFILTLV